MVFRRRDRRPLWRVVADLLWPRSGWMRAFYYVQHRVRRLPDAPHRIARGIFAGVFVCFTPLFGLHFFLAALIAWVIRGNVLAALLATFVGNPLTFLPIAALSLQTGYFLLGHGLVDKLGDDHKLGPRFIEAWRDLRDNFLAIFTDAQSDWSGLIAFYHEVFLPYLIGGVVPGLIAGLVGYYVSLPLIKAYQNRRSGAIKARLAALRAKASRKADTTGDHE